MRLFRVGFCGILVVLFGFASLNHAAEAVFGTEVSYTGVMPCADCPGIAWHLDLWPSGRYHLRRDYQERGGSDNEVGRWHSNSPEGRLLLFGERDTPLRLAVVDANTLRLLDNEGKTIKSRLPYELQRAARFEPVELALPLWGEFEYFADTASLRECLSGHTYPVLMQGAYLELERRFLQLRSENSDEKLFVQLDASILNRQIHVGEGLLQSLRVERVVSAMPGVHCESAMSK